MAQITAILSAPSHTKFAVSQSFAGLRSRDLILNRSCSVHLGYKPLVVAFSSSLQATRVPTFSRNMRVLDFPRSTGLRDKYRSVLSWQLLGEVADISASSMKLQACGKTNVLPRPQRSLLTTRAYKDEIFEFRYPVITEKPEWWWRTLACVPYLIALQMSDAGSLIQPFLEQYDQIFENLIYLVPGPKNGFPPWLLLIYKHFGYKWIVKNKDLPHFIRFHTIMAMLLKTGLQLVWHTCKLFPFMEHDGMLGKRFWAVIGFCFILVLLECVRCALGGRYADILFVSDAADTHTQYNIVSFQNPCRYTYSAK